MKDRDPIETELEQKAIAWVEGTINRAELQHAAHTFVGHMHARASQKLKAGIDTITLVKILLPFKWQRECVIIPNYMPPYPRSDTKPSVQVRFREGFLRYSQGPRQHYFWDVYGYDMITIELALLALSQAPCPQGGESWDVDVREPFDLNSLVQPQTKYVVG